jgi:LysR family transcriptional regulator (chromosome initiation inhibitor)
VLDYGSLSAVAAVVREGSFEHAARALGVTPSAVSQRVRALEERLGSVLIVRGQPCRATSAGTRICAHVERVRLLEGEMVGDLPALFGDADAKGPPTVRIAVNRDSLGTWFMPAIAGFTQRTGALVDVVLDREEYTSDRLRTGEVLAAVTDDASPVQGCRKLALGNLRYVATATPDFARTWFLRGADAKALAKAPVIMFDRPDHLQTKWAREIQGARLAGPMHWIPATREFLDATLAGIGWGMNPLCLVKDMLVDGRLVDLSPGKHVDVALYWQCARIGGKLLDALTKEVVAAGKQGLVTRKVRAVR